ncbi:RagB/SusD family nutrient uptake outer membrane protein [Emticicia sp. W12TSBA100-4]|uniref:RagB/SusD family nutrient uptake outer membrane protein n=1 Tax=Emticicia sp. W12TSBA100-4 TaxID=3160965 RepID=UPI003305D4D1
MKKIKILALLFLSLCLGSCEKYLDINQDPSNPQVAEGHVLLPALLQSMVRGEAFDSRYIGQYIQNWHASAAGNTWDRHGYAAGSDAAGEKWRQHYYALGQNLLLQIKDGEEKGKWDYSGVAKAIQAWSWQSTTDYHGEMILKEMFEPNRYVFDYDTQEEVYAEVVRVANNALTDLNRTDGIVSTASLSRGDLVYKGDRTKWIKFVYGVLARNAHHLSNKSTYNPDKVIEYVDKSFVSNADNFNIPHAGTSSTDANFFGPTRNNMGSYRQSAYIVALLDGTILKAKDPRLALTLSPSVDGTYRGVNTTFGDPNSANVNTRIPTLWNTVPGVTALTGKYMFQDKIDYPIMTYSELQFIKAEALFKKGDKAKALEAYKNGITAHMNYVGVAAKDQTDYLASAAVINVAADLKLSDIMTQKYISLWGIGCLESWVDMRRYNYSSDVFLGFTLPVTTQLSADNNGKPAQRVRPRYNSEYVWNRNSLDLIGGNNNDYHTYELWFSKK